MSKWPKSEITGHKCFEDKSYNQNDLMSKDFFSQYHWLMRNLMCTNLCHVRIKIPLITR